MAVHVSCPPDSHVHFSFLLLHVLFMFCSTYKRKGGGEAGAACSLPLGFQRSFPWICPLFSAETLWEITADVQNEFYISGYLPENLCQGERDLLLSKEPQTIVAWVGFLHGLLIYLQFSSSLNKKNLVNLHNKFCVVNLHKSQILVQSYFFTFHYIQNAQEPMHAVTEITKFFVNIPAKR